MTPRAINELILDLRALVSMEAFAPTGAPAHIIERAADELERLTTHPDPQEQPMNDYAAVNVDLTRLAPQAAADPYPGRVADHLEALNDTLMRIAKRVHVLTDTLGPILRETDSAVTPHDGPPPPRCALATTLHAMSSDGNRILDELDVLLNRIEL